MKINSLRCNTNKKIQICVYIKKKRDKTSEGKRGRDMERDRQRERGGEDESVAPSAVQLPSRQWENNSGVLHSCARSGACH